MEETIEIVGGEGIETALKELGIDANRTYCDDRYEIWELSKKDFDEKLDNIPDSEWKDTWGWWRWTIGSNLEDEPRCEITINNSRLIAYYSMYGLEDYIEEEREFRDDEELTDDQLTEEFLSKRYSSLTDYMQSMWGATTESNVAAIAISLARLNKMSLGQLFTEYQGDAQ